MKVKHLHAWLSSAATMTMIIAGAASAQVSAPPVRETMDANSVDLVRGAFVPSATDLTIGPSGSHGLTYSRSWEQDGWRDNLSSGISGSTQNPVVTIDGASDSFTLQSNGAYSPDQGNGATLTVSGSTYTYTSSSGAVAQFADASTFGMNPRALSNIGWITSLTYPDGNVATFNYKTETIYWGTFSSQEVRLRSVTNSFGYMLHLDYAASSLSSSTAFTWSQVTTVTAINTQVEGCDPSADTCNMSRAWPKVTYGYYASPNTYTPPINAATDPMGHTSQYSYGTYHGTDFLTSLRRPGASADDVSVIYHDNAPNQDEYIDVTLQSVTKAGSTWSYAYDDTVAQRRTIKTTNPNNTFRTMVIDTNIAEPVTSTNEVGATTGYLFNAQGHLAQMTYPEGNVVSYGYDGRGNTTSVTQTPKPNQNGGATITTTAYYDPNCSNARICNQPIWTRDANGNQTDYGYDAGIGRVTSVTLPAGANGVRPQTRYYYANVNGAGLWLLGATSTCRTSSNCGGNDDEVRADTGFGNASQNYMPMSITKRAGDSSVSATTQMTYDAIGNIVTSTDPVGAQTRMNYDADREATETISADPDGGGPLKPRAVRVNYNGDGTIASKEVGTDDGTFASFQQLVTGYDSYGRKVQDTMTAGGTTYGVTQYGYDGMSRLLCTTTRMNAGAFGSLPGACTMGNQGSDGPDRITLYDYDGANRVKMVTSGSGTNVQAVEQTGYYLNGTTSTVTDAKGNVTQYVYDGYDRLNRTYYPSQSATGQIDAGNYEELGYDARGLVTSRRLRDGNSYDPSYDALGNMTNDGQGHSFSYDNLGELLSANDGNNAYENFGWDALGRKTNESAAHGGTASMSYDAAGRRTRLTWADGFYVNYNYDLLGEMTGITENSGAVLISIGYDDLGRRTVLNRANGSATSYSYDGASRLTGLTHGGNANVTFGYGYNAGGQITSRTMSNDAYAWTGAVTTDRGYSVNGLNQYTQSGSITPTYDGRGNLTSAGNTSYSYNLNNQLTNFSGGYIYRNALGEWLDVNTEQQWMVYDGDRTIEELGYDGTIKRRYVYGPGGDEPLIWYEGSGTSDRRYLHADERGSIVAVTDQGGNVSAINTYDEFGIPGANNQGRFQYTGQRWIPALGMYDYKARMYSPTLGRFLQTDPIGYDDGLNWYNYVGGDPINNIDPTGTTKDKPTITIHCDGSGICTWTSSDGRSGRWDPQTNKVTQDITVTARAGNSTVVQISIQIPISVGFSQSQLDLMKQISTSFATAKTLAAKAAKEQSQACGHDIAAGVLSSLFGWTGLVQSGVGAGAAVGQELNGARGAVYVGPALSRGLLAAGRGLVLGALTSEITGAIDGYRKSSSCQGK